MFVASQGVEYSCGADANGWIESWFGDCVYTPWETAAFFIGLSSVCLWIVAQLPQFISNFMRSAADALSPWFLTQWLAGDTFNFLGCVLTGDQLKTQTITAGYFIFSDIVIITQYVYYQVRNRNAIDFDESVHKGTGYSSALKGNDNRKLAFEDQGAHNTRASEDNLVCASTMAASADNDGSKKYNKYRVRSTSDRGNTNYTEPSDCMHLNEALLPPALSDLEQKGGWMFEHRHRLRRLVQEYNLDYGHGVAKRLASLYKNKCKEKCKNNQPRQALENAVSAKKVRHKAVLGITGVFGVVSVSKFQTFPSPGNLNNSRVEIALGRRALLALDNAGAVMREKSSFKEIGQPAAAYVAGHLLPLSHQTYPWVMMIGRFLGWSSSALYLGSRLSQLIKNKQRQSADGLSLGMVTCAVLANVTYGVSIVMRGPSWDNLIGKAPWLVGSFGTVFLDFSILLQAYYYSWHSQKGEPNEYAPLLS